MTHWTGSYRSDAIALSWSVRVRWVLVAALSLAIANTSPGAQPEALLLADTVFVPLRATSEWLGAQVTYSGGQITIRSGATVLELRAGSSKGVVDGTSISMPTPPLILKDMTYVPLRFVAESLGARVDYDAGRSRVKVVHGERTLELAAKRHQGVLPPALQTDSHEFLSALIRAINRQDAVAVRGALIEPLPYFETLLTGSGIEAMMHDYLFQCVNEYGAWQFDLTPEPSFTGVPGDYMVNAGERYQNPDDAMGEGEYSSLWILRKVNGYWRVVGITSV